MAYGHFQIYTYLLSPTLCWPLFQAEVPSDGDKRGAWFLDPREETESKQANIKENNCVEQDVL